MGCEYIILRQLQKSRSWVGMSISRCLGDVADGGYRFAFVILDLVEI